MGGGGGGGREGGGERRRDGVRRETEREDSGGQVEEEVEREGDRQMEQDNNKNATKTDLYSQKQKEKKNTPKNTNSTANKVYMTTECGVTQRERTQSCTKCQVIKKVVWGHTKRARNHTKHAVMKRQSMKLDRAWSHTQQRQSMELYREHGITLIQDRITQSMESNKQHEVTKRQSTAPQENCTSPLTPHPHPPPPTPGTHAMYRKQVKLTLQLARQVSHHVWLVKAGTELNQRLLVGNHNFLYKQNRHSIEQNQKRSLIHNVTML